MNHVIQYLTRITEKLLTGEAREHAYRPPLEELLQSIDGYRVVNDPARSKFGAPDFIVLKELIPIAYIETKDLGEDLDKVERTEQIERYRGYPKLILTNYIEFRFFRDGEPYGEKIKIASLSGKTLGFYGDTHYELLVRDLAAFFELGGQTITSTEKLSRIMGGRARRLRDNIILFSKNPDLNSKILLEQFEVFKKLLIHDLTAEQFADMYAQTLVYGLFVARYNDSTAENFTRQEAQELIPQSNPFLRRFFSDIAGPDFDKRLDYIISDLCAIFAATNVKGIMEVRFKQEGLWGERSDAPDPVIHFYEDFLKEYDPKQRVERGVFYTPPPIVRFIVRSVDKILKTAFNLPQGLADISKVTVKISAQEYTNSGVLKKVKHNLHRVQILDPAVGTGTFLNEVIHKIYKSFKKGQEGQWSSYVNDNLIPRLHGFELMMASYTIAHLKLAMVLSETGAILNDRIGVYLTNSLERGGEVQLQLDLGLMRSLSEESVGASRIKEETPIMVVVGNPPYSAISSNKSAKYLVEKYKVEPGGMVRLKERKNWLDDDYVKFISFAENFIDKNDEGIVAMITNHGYIDNPTFRGMRWHLMKTFDLIYILDLHGNSKKKEVSPDGTKDENVFDIQQGVAVILAVKTGKKKLNQLADVYHADIYGKREQKFAELDKEPKWQHVTIDKKMYFFVNKNTKGVEEYEKGFAVNELFRENTTGIVTMGDAFIIDKSKEVLEKRITHFLSEEISEETLKTKYELGKNYAKWIIGNKKTISSDPNKIISLVYRPFDIRYTYFDNKLIWRPRTKLMNNFVHKNNLGLICKRGLEEEKSPPIFISNVINESRSWSRPGMRGIESIYPLYLYADDGSKVTNFKKDIVNDIDKIVGKTIPEDIFDYIYAVLHSPSYREKYKEFLKIDFPRVPYPKDAKQFKGLAEKGKELRLLHLLEHPILDKFITTFPVVGGNFVDKKYPKYKDGKVYINDSQYFGDVPDVAWNFWIGGYQPAQKWLKDCRGRLLSSDEIVHYQKVIIALTETDRIMNEIDEIGK